jgi:hypothetical protein
MEMPAWLSKLYLYLFQYSLINNEAEILFVVFANVVVVVVVVVVVSQPGEIKKNLNIHILNS